MSFTQLYEQQLAAQASYEHGGEYVSAMLLGLHEEAAELARACAPAWKSWKPESDGDVAGEIADVLIFVINIAGAHGLAASEVLHALREKIAYNAVRSDHQRLR